MFTEIYDFSIWKTINKFSDIQIKPNTLVLCDIDYTILHHPAINNSWVALINSFFYMKHNMVNDFETKMEVEKDVTQFIDKVFAEIPIRHTDRDGFLSILGKTSDFAFVTARSIEAKEFTYENLRGLDIDPEKYPVHFCGYEPKGEYINKTFDLHKYDHVIFIDDQSGNLENVFMLLSHPGLELYKFKYEIEYSPYYYYPLPPGFNPRLRFDGECVIQIDDSLLPNSL